MALFLWLVAWILVIQAARMTWTYSDTERVQALSNLEYFVYVVAGTIVISTPWILLSGCMMFSYHAFFGS